MNKYSVRVVKKKHEVREIEGMKEVVVYTDDILNIFITANNKKEARRKLRLAEQGKYSNLMDYRIGRVTQIRPNQDHITLEIDVEDGFSIPLHDARLKKHWEI